jgi:hypothetical protein
VGNSDLRRLREILEIQAPGLFLPSPNLSIGIFLRVIGHFWQQGRVIEGFSLLVGAGVPGEGTHFRDSHITVHRFNLVLPIGGEEDPITSVTAQSYNQGSCIEKERHRWGEQVAATRFTQRLIIARPNINPRWWSHQVR